MTIIDKAAQLIFDEFTPILNPKALAKQCAQALADAGLLRPEPSDKHMPKYALDAISSALTRILEGGSDA